LEGDGDAVCDERVLEVDVSVEGAGEFEISARCLLDWCWVKRERERLTQ
jgi:hypothetical protein